MRYISNRDQFLRSYKSSKNQIYEKTPYSGEEFRIYEEYQGTGSGAGIFHNDVGWNDSLLGRFINHIIRKVKIAIGKMQLSGLIRQLKMTFEEIVSRGRVAAMDADDRTAIIKLQIYSFFYELIQAVERGEKVGILKKLTNEAIDALESVEDFDEKESLNDELVAFLEFLEQFDDDEGDVEGDEDVESEEGENKEGENKEGDKKGTGEEGFDKFRESVTGEIYAQMIKNLSSLSLIISNYKKVNVEKLGSTKSDKTQVLTYVTKDGDTLEKIASDTTVNKKNLKAKDILAKNQMVKQNNQPKKLTDFFKAGQEKTKTPLPAGILLKLENNYFSDTDLESLFENAIGGTNKTGSSNPIGSGSGTNRSNVSSGESHLSQAFDKIKKSIETLVDSKAKGVGVSTESLQEMISKKMDEKVKDQIIRLYYEIKRYVVGDKKGTLNAPKDPLYKESLEFLSDKNKRVILAEKIARFYAGRISQLKGTNLEGGLGDLKQPLLDFRTTMESILKPVKNESKSISNYDDFIRLIKEAEGDDDDKKDDKKEENDENTGDGSNNKGSKTSQKIREWFNKNCKGVISYSIEEAEAKRLREEFDKVKPTDFVIDGFDPIIQIIRIFNRAYKIYTTRIISKRSQGVTGGTSGPSAGTAMEYMPLGSGGAAPYRHISTFNIWEDAVFDILGNREYQEIFDKKTGLRVGDEIRPEKGVALRRFIFDLLDGGKLYGREDGGGSGEGKGIQSKFLEEYFGEVDSQAKSAVTTINTEEGGGEASEIQEDAEDGKIEVSATNAKNINVQNLSIGNIFTISSSEINEATGDSKQYTFMITSIKDGFTHLIYFTSIGGLYTLFQNVGNIDVSRIKGEFQELNIYKAQNNGSKLERHYTRVRSDQFFNLLKVGSSIKLKNVVNENQMNDVKVVNVKIDSLYWLTKKNKENKKILFSLKEESLERAMNFFKTSQWKWAPQLDNKVLIEKYVK